ncbi:MAG: hypothetical protein DMG81_19520 [Acidobacteria bacterium]|nr:MAG: hypothetical protein DMG81_19520 [Acidobacteriota bacterium]
MSHLTISEVARQVGLNSSAIRYYEQIGILPAAERISGQRRYDRSALYRLAVVKRGHTGGSSLEKARRSETCRAGYNRGADQELARFVETHEGEMSLQDAGNLRQMHPGEWHHQS